MLKSRKRRPKYKQNGNSFKNPLLKAKRVYSWGAQRVQSGVKNQTKRIQNDHKLLEKLAYLSSLAFAGMVIGLFMVIAIFAFFSRGLPSPDTLLERSAELSTKFYDRNGELLYEVFGEKNRTLVPFDDIPEDVIHATLTIEDSEFYLHQGYSLRGMLRAVRNMVFGEGGIQSGSTLTQQVIKNTLLTHEQTLPRKIKEVILSLQLENRYAKNDILQMYLNESPYGGQNYGIYSAAKAYFNKEPKDLTLAESAYLAGLPQSPSVYSQFGINPEAGIERKNYILYLMNERGWVGPDGRRYYLSDEEYEEALDVELEFDTAKVPLAAPHFIFYAKQVLIDMFGEVAVEQGGLRVTTTLDLEAHTLAQDILYEEVESAKDLNVWNGSMVVIDPKTAQIISMVGSKGYNLDPEPEGCTSGIAGENGCKFDPYLNVSLASRQPGSAIKPITYATMIAQGYPAAFPLLDVPTVFQGSAPDKPYIPENYDGKFRGPMSLRKSLANSLNIPAVKALKIVGIDNMIDTAEKMGITTFSDRSRYGLALTLGGGEVKLMELTGAFSVFAAKGIYRVPTPILKVEDAYGNTLYEWQDTGGIRALGEDTSFLISDILSDDGARSEVFGFGSALNIPGHQVAVKTGTTDDKRDNYALGFTPSVVAGVWVGNNNNEKMNPYVASGITGATPIWNRFMRAYLEDKDNEKFEPPENVEKHEVDRLTGMRPYGEFDTRVEWFVKGTEPTAPSDWYKRLEICKVDGRIANDACDDADETKEKTYIDIQAALPEWQSAVDAWVKENYGDADEYYPPRMKSKLEFDGDDVSNKNEVYAEIVGLSDGDTVPLYFRLSVETSAYRDIEEVRIYMDGNQVTADHAEPFGYNFELDVESIGEHEFSVTAEDEKGNKGKDSLRLNVAGWNL
jgi:membrane peptidoglycan carboxypeptidase